MVACALVSARPAAIRADLSRLRPHPFQKIQMPTAAEVAKAWVNPPSEYGPEPYFGMNGPVTIESLAHDLDTMKASASTPSPRRPAAA
jgi:hypothetical protein